MASKHAKERARFLLRMKKQASRNYDSSLILTEHLDNPYFDPQPGELELSKDKPDELVLSHEKPDEQEFCRSKRNETNLSHNEPETDC